jgi:hypothetical protein
MNFRRLIESERTGVERKWVAPVYADVPTVTDEINN